MNQDTLMFILYVIGSICFMFQSISIIFYIIVDAIQGCLHEYVTYKEKEAKGQANIYSLISSLHDILIRKPSNSILMAISGTAAVASMITVIYACRYI